jgi:hypothetical protein
MCEPGQIGYRRKMPQRAEHPLPTADGPRGRPGRRVRAHAALAATLPLVLAGCTGAPGPTGPGPTTARNHGTVATASPIPSSSVPQSGPPFSPTVAPPPRTAAIDRNDADGAVAAATYFISLYSYAYATGNLSEWIAMSDPACVFCSGLTEDVRKATVAGTKFQGGDLSILSSGSSVGEKPNLFLVDLVVSQAPFKEFDRSGKILSEGAGVGATDVRAVLVHGPNGWLVRAAKTEITGK